MKFKYIHEYLRITMSLCLWFPWYHFEDVAGSNKASEPGTSEVRSIQCVPKTELSLGQCSSAWLLTGAQLVSKFNEEVSRAAGSRVCSPKWNVSGSRAVVWSTVTDKEVVRHNATSNRNL